jgi:hypothetical protein
MLILVLVIIPYLLKCVPVNAWIFTSALEKLQGSLEDVIFEKGHMLIMPNDYKESWYIPMYMAVRYLNVPQGEPSKLLRGVEH